MQTFILSEKSCWDESLSRNHIAHTWVSSASTHEMLRPELRGHETRCGWAQPSVYSCIWARASLQLQLVSPGLPVLWHRAQKRPLVCVYTLRSVCESWVGPAGVSVGVGVCLVPWIMFNSGTWRKNSSILCLSRKARHPLSALRRFRKSCFW